MSQECDFVLNQVALIGFQLQICLSQALENLPQPRYVTLYVMREDNNIVEVAQADLQV
jgi:hypothetical protein